jgi:hypothetical protein
MYESEQAGFMPSCHLHTGLWSLFFATYSKSQFDVLHGNEMVLFYLSLRCGTGYGTCSSFFLNLGRDLLRFLRL